MQKHPCPFVWSRRIHTALNFCTVPIASVWPRLSRHRAIDIFHLSGISSGSCSLSFSVGGVEVGETSDVQIWRSVISLISPTEVPLIFQLCGFRGCWSNWIWSTLYWLRYSSFILSCSKGNSPILLRAWMSWRSCSCLVYSKKKARLLSRFAEDPIWSLPGYNN